MKKIAIVTGSASGIGLNIAQNFVREGYGVVLCDLNEDALAQAAKDLPKESVLALKCDVGKEEEVKQLIDRTHEVFGRIDVLINNAGLQYVARLEDFPTAKFNQMLQVMLTGAFCTTKFVLPIMKDQKFGRIINMASINGLIGFAGKAAYNSAKHGLIGLTKVTALECATFGITANAICPGYIDTPLVRGQMQDLARTRGVDLERVLEEVLFSLIPQKQLIDINDIASMALFLASHAAKHITGQSMVIDAGYTAQ